MRWKQMVNPPWPSVVALVMRTSCVHLKENWKSGVSTSQNPVNYHMGGEAQGNINSDHWENKRTL